MSNLDISRLVVSALEFLNYSSDMTNNIDNHSSIEISLLDLPSIYISVCEGRVWLWSYLCESSEGILNQCATEFLRILMEGCNVAITGQLQLDKQESYLVLKGMVDNDFLCDGVKFSEALNEYFIQLECFHRALLK